MLKVRDVLVNCANVKTDDFFKLTFNCKDSVLHTTSRIKRCKDVLNDINLNSLDVLYFEFNNDMLEIKVECYILRE